MVRLHVVAVCAIFAFLAGFSQGQENKSAVFLGDQEVRVIGLAGTAAAAKTRTAALAAALEIVVHDKKVCCEKDSALADAVAYAAMTDPPLKDLAAKLEGRQLTDDKDPILVSAKYVPGSSITGDFIVRSLLGQHALVVEWKAHIYVLQGALYNEVRDSSGAREFSVIKLFLLDPRFSDERRTVIFDRKTDDLTNVQGALAVTVSIPPSAWK